MRHHLIFAAALALLLSDAALAGENCRLLSSLSGYPIESCKCGTDLVSPRSESLPTVATCRYTKESWGASGAFLHAGDLTLTGSIRREDSMTFGDRHVFIVEASSRKRLPTTDFVFSVANNQRVKTFGSPSLSDQSTCWRAKATIRIKQLLIVIGDGTDSEGAYIVDYDVAKVGKFEKCEPDVYAGDELR